MKRPVAFYPLLLLLVFLGTSAVFGAWMLLFNASKLGMPIEWLDDTPFSTFLVPALILFFCNGLLPLFAAVGLIFRPDWSWANVANVYSTRHWGWTYSLYSGFSIIIWITVQIIVVEYSILQPFYIAVGLLIQITTLTPKLMRYYTYTR